VEFLLGPDSQELAGAVLLACSDAALQLLAAHRDALQKRYRLDLANPPAQLAMLDKLRTYELARTAGVATPKFWAVQSRDEVQSLRAELVFPLMVKPRLSHVFEKHFGTKHIVAENFEELLSAFDVAVDAGISVLLVEWIPGGDDQLCSYYTYVDETGKPLCDYTKRIIRRFPVGMGAACYHVTGDVPEIVAPSLKLIKHAGVLGLANIEFKRDPRDGQHKLIECNARFTASNSLVSASGLRLASFVYQRAVGRSAELVFHRGRSMRLWDPLRDWAAFLQLRRMKQITFPQWLRSVMHRHRFPYFKLSDPWPTLWRLSRSWRRLRTIKGKGP
jgi:predicted ATP-grasp superfamily ATP-dependent carboligase